MRFVQLLHMSLPTQRKVSVALMRDVIGISHVGQLVIIVDLVVKEQ